MPIGESLDKILTQVKGLTFANVAIMIILFIVAMPAYIGWRVLNDKALMALVFSNYEELDAATACELVVAQPAGGTPGWYIRNLFQERNNEVWYVSVRLRFQPDDEAMQKFCGALDQVIDYARDPHTELEPLFPGSVRPIFPPDSTIERRKELDKFRNRPPSGEWSSPSMAPPARMSSPTTRELKKVQ